MILRRCLLMGIVGLIHATQASTQEAIDARLMAEIERIRAIDNHTHAEPADPARGANWRTEKPLGEPRYPDVEPLRRDKPEWILAWKALYGYRHSDSELGHLQALLQSKRQKIRERGEAWPREVLDKAGVDIALVNAPSLGPGQDRERFRWVPYADELISPFARDAGAGALPRSLDEYRSQVLEPAFARWVKAGAVAVKFRSAYTRSLDFSLVDRAKAEPLYAKGTAGQALVADEQKALEDFLFYAVAELAGANGLVVHIHTGNGDGPYFNNERASPGLLETALNSKALRGTNFVLVHGGWPYPLVTQAMLDKPNTYADFSAQTFYLTTHALAQVLRGWLGWHPEKVLFGTDAYSDTDSPLTDYEEKEWLMTHRSRRALAIALTAMMRDGEISRTRAEEIARLVMRGNAERLYRINGPVSSSTTR
jgi:uncharacterized protein